jgi:hypothetical protein
MDDVPLHRTLIGRLPTFQGDANMGLKQLIAIPFVLASSTALAQQSLPTVEVRVDSERTMVIACSNPKPEMKDVERVLQITDSKQTPSLRKQLMAAAAEGCTAGIPRIEVTRTGNSLKWKAMD